MNDFSQMPPDTNKDHPTPTQFCSMAFHSSFFEPLCVSQGFGHSVCMAEFRLNSSCQSALKFSSSLPLSVRAAITRCQRLGKRVNNRSLLSWFLGLKFKTRALAWPPSEESPHGLHRALSALPVEVCIGTLCPPVEEQATELSRSPL